LIGHFSDVLKHSYGADSLRYAAVGCTAFYIIAALLMLFCVPLLRTSWVEDSAS
jgi:hypothetical protein